MSEKRDPLSLLSLHCVVCFKVFELQISHTNLSIFTTGVAIHELEVDRLVEIVEQDKVGFVPFGIVCIFDGFSFSSSGVVHITNVERDIGIEGAEKVSSLEI